MNLQDKISSSKAKLLVEYPLFGTIASKLELVQNDDIESFKSNGIKLEYSSDFLQTITEEEIQFVFANGAMHASLLHDRRRNGRSSQLWQLATDYAVNDMLVQNGLCRPMQAHYSKRFSGLYAEEIYKELQEDILREDLHYEEDLLEDLQQEDLKEQNREDGEDLAEQLFEEFAKTVLQSELKRGELPVLMDRFFNINARNSKINWRDELRAALDRFHKDDYTLLPPAKKLLYRGVYLPSCISQKFTFAVAIDSSGSVDEELLGKFISELNSLTNTLQNYQIELLVCDDKIRMHKTFYSGDIVDFEIIGGGATDFRAVFEFIKDELEDVKLLIYFTDLDGAFPEDEPTYRVKWISAKEAYVPFGDLIILED